MKGRNEVITVLLGALLLISMAGTQSKVAGDPYVDTSQVTGSNSATATAILTDNTFPELVYVYSQNDCTCTATFSTSGGNGTVGAFTQRYFAQTTNPANGDAYTSYEEWALAKTQLSGVTLTVTWSGSPTTVNHVTVLTIIGSNLDSPFDGSVTLPCANVGGASLGHCVVSSSQQGDLIVGNVQIECQNNPQCQMANLPVTALTDWASIQHSHPTGADGHDSQWNVVFPKQTNLNVSWSYSTVHVTGWSVVVDAVAAMAPLAIDDNLIWGSMLFLSVVFSILALDFPIKVGKGEKVAPGQVWTHIRAMIFPLFASISWYIMAAFSVAAGNGGTHILYYYFVMLFSAYLVVGIVLIFYLAFNPIVEVLEGRAKLEQG